MRAVIQKVKSAACQVDQQIVGSIENGLLVLLGIHKNDELKQAQELAKKTANLRIFPNDQGKMDHNITQIGGQILVISQFTLYGNCQKGNRPDFLDAKPPKQANVLYELYVELLKERNVQVQTGIFGAYMEISLVNEGPVTLIVEANS